MKTNPKTARRINLLMSIIIAFAAWFYVVYNYCPTKEVVYQDVPIVYDGEDILAAEGLAINESSDEAISVTLSIRRADYGDVSADSISVVADVSEAVEGENGISLNITPPAGSTLSEASKTAISIDVQGCESKTVSVAVVYGDVGEVQGEPAAYDMSAEAVEISGTAENLEKVKNAVIKLKMADVSEELKAFSAEPIAIDDENCEVKHISIYPNAITFDAVSGVTKRVPIKYNIVDDSDLNKEYEAPGKVTIKGPAEILDAIDSIETEEIDITDISENSEIAISFVLPEGTNIAQTSMGLKMKIKIAGDNSAANQ